MKKNLNRNLKPLSLPWLALLAGVVLVLLSLSFIYEIHRAQNTVSQYVGLWEEDLAKALLLGKDPALFDKILAQLQDLHPAVQKVELADSAILHCGIFNEAPITLYSLPAGKVNVCYSVSKLGLRAVLSPIFLMGLFIVLGIVFFGLRREMKKILQEEKLRVELEKNQQIAALSRQVAHDIRGPLMALNTLSSLSHEMSPEKQQLFSMAVSRIKGIADDLLLKARVNQNRKSQGEGMFLLCEKLLQEFRLTFPSVAFSLHNHLSQDVVLSLDHGKFQRVLANIINNGIEALPDENGTVAITLLERQNEIQIQIMDNGAGIPEEILPRLMQEGASFGKAQGNGLGLYDAQKTLAAMNGKIHIQSKLGVGTLVTLSMPLSVESSESAQG